MTIKLDSNKPKQAGRLTPKKETVKDLDPRDAQLKGGAASTSAGPVSAPLGGPDAGTDAGTPSQPGPSAAIMRQ
jgi:hypothetical protein